MHFTIFEGTADSLEAAKPPYKAGGGLRPWRCILEVLLICFLRKVLN
jgi:hypothetical protein